MQIYRQELKILGNLISKNKVFPDPEKKVAIEKYERPKTIRELRSFLGLANYTRNFIPKYAHLSALLTKLLKGETKRRVKNIRWSEEEENAFQVLKKTIADITYRSQPNFKRVFKLITDASNEAIGAVLVQKDDFGCDKIIYAFSKVLEKAQKNYSATDKELLAVVKGVEFLDITY